MSDELDSDVYCDNIQKSSVYVIMKEWITDNSNQRFGQYFVNKYITNAWPELFYANDNESYIMIAEWLIDNQYEYDLPALRKVK